MSDTEFGNYVFSNNLTVFEALSELDVVDLRNDIQANNALIVQTRSELHATTQLLDTTVARVNTIDAVLAEVRSDVNSLSSDVNALDSEISELQDSVANAQQTADSAASSAANALTEARSARSLAGNAAIAANAASTAAGTAQSTANAAQTSANQANQTANAATVSISSLNNTVNHLRSLIAETRLLADQIFARENDLITGWGLYQNRDTLFQMRSNRSTNGVMMTNVRFTASVRLASGVTLPYTEFWIRSPGEIGQPTYPAARVRTGQWILYLTGGSGSAQQLFINPFNIRDYRP
uniref:ORF3 protein n=1 Tax=Spodoptera exigua virus AKJ-2014 TaxID=1453322 RepID=A0A023NHN1_9PICO|nr:ORF3 protein [Spodoptera exigua virus AKJ-2014]